MTDWYIWFLLCVLILWALSVPRDRYALRIILIASLASEILVMFTRQIHAPWKMAVPGMVETLTILALLQWAKNRTGHLNIGLLSVAWVAHVFCYLDVWLRTDIVYSRYEAILFLVAVAQLCTFHATFARCGGLIVGLLNSIGVRRPRSVCLAGVRNSILRTERTKVLQANR